MKCSSVCLVDLETVGIYAAYPHACGFAVMMNRLSSMAAILVNDVGYSQPDIFLVVLLALVVKESRRGCIGIGMLGTLVAVGASVGPVRTPLDIASGTVNAVQAKSVYG